MLEKEKLEGFRNWWLRIMHETEEVFGFVYAFSEEDKHEFGGEVVSGGPLDTSSSRDG